MYVQDRASPPNVDISEAQKRRSMVKWESGDQEDEEESDEDEMLLPKPKGTLQGFVVDNFPKIVIIAFVILSALILMLLRSRGENAALLCIESMSRQIEEIPYPVVNFAEVSSRVDKGMYALFKADKWIVVAVTEPPTQEVQSLAKLDGWQVIAIGNSQTPNDWEVPGVIFLSMTLQANLGYRIQKQISLDSSARKNIAYLFAIQHGAQVIYDADEKASVLGGNLEKVFNVELSGSKGRIEPFHQYRMVENRTVVNPYIHFGQRSMWPRGFPIRLVGESSTEVSYNEVSPGRNFIQQGLSNGLPDVDSLFYYTRRSEREPVNVEFDPAAPPVALPQGTMAPVSSINTIFHKPAFWSLMIPISVSPRAADIVRGYWAQRLVWEIGGMLVVYPPSAYKFDQMEPILQQDEKDLHKNMERLIKFLLSWRSDKSTVFQKIIHLSHAMAEGGYWNIQNVQFTAAWLEDLVSVGYLQPRLLALELGRVSPSLYNSDHKQFVPEALPSVYLGIHESSAMEKEMGDWLKWRRFYGNIVLILEFSPNANGTVLAWRMLYGRLFKHVVIHSSVQRDPALHIESGNWSQTYESIPEVFQQYPNAEGFLYLKDSVVFNYWNFLTSNKNKIWSLQKSKPSWQVIGFRRPGSAWYVSLPVKRNVRAAVRSLPPRFLSTYRKSMDDIHYVVSSSDAFYIPRRYTGDFKALVAIGIKAQLRPEVAIPLFLMAMDKPSAFDSEAFKNVGEAAGSKRDPAVIYRKEKHVLHPWRVRNESEIVRVIKAMSIGDPLLARVL